MGAMGDNVINLRQARKQRARAAKAARADENRHKFGRSKADKQREAGEQDRAARHVEGHKLPRGDDCPADNE